MHTSPAHVATPEISVGLSRSWLLVPAGDARSLDSSRATRADQIVVDIEDAVDQTRKAEARGSVATWLGSGGHAWVRINDRTTTFWGEDIDALRGIPGLRGVMLAKTESADDVAETAERLGGATPVLALVETALGIEEAVNIARAPGVVRLAFGSGDYRRDTGASADPLALLYPRSRLVVASRVGHLPGPIDGPTMTADLETLTEQTALAVKLGMTGKLCLDQNHPAAINDAISPPASEVSWARQFLSDFAAGGGVVRDGSYLPQLGRAQKVDELARAFGVQ